MVLPTDIYLGKVSCQRDQAVSSMVTPSSAFNRTHVFAGHVFAELCPCLPSPRLPSVC